MPQPANQRLVTEAALAAALADLPATDTSALVAKSLYNTNTVLAATTDDTPVAVTVAAATVLGRKATGGIVAMTMDELATLLALVSTDISDFAEAVDDRVNALVVEGSGITKTYNDAGNLLTISATGTAASTILPVDTQLANFTLANAHASRFQACQKATRLTVTVPKNSTQSIDVGQIFPGNQDSTGEVFWSFESGVGFYTPAGLGVPCRTRIEGSKWSLFKLRTDAWLLDGDVVAA